MAIALSFTLVIMAAVTLMLGINVLIYDDINQKHNQHYVILCGASSIWSFSHAALGLSSNEEVAILFRSVAFIGILIVIAKGIVLASYWTEMSKKFQKALQLYVTIVSLIIYPMIIERGSVTFTQTRYGYFCTFKRYPGRTVFMLYVLTLLVIGSIIVYHGFHASKRMRQKKMAVSTLICMCVFAIGMVFDILLPLFGIPSFPASAISQFFSVLLVYMVSLRYNVSRMTVANVSEYIYSYVKTPIIILDEQGIVQLANTCAGTFFSMPIDQVIGKSADTFFDIKKEEGGEIGTGTLFGECRLNGAKCDLAVNEIVDHYKEPLGKLMIITDITDKMDLIHKLGESRQEAIQANEAKSAFLANMSHEIRTPMNTIIGISEILLKRDMDDEVREKIRLIRNSGTGLLTVINDILDISKIESGKFEIIEGQYMLASMIVDVVNMMAVRLVDTGIYFLVKVDDRLPASLIGDDLRIKQILTNIIGNAIKFTHHGVILVDISGHYSSKEEIRLIIKVQDSGIGIREEDMGKLFGIFNQVDTRRNRNIRGTGLGLAISKNLSKLMGGDIEVESEYGVGSTFTIELTQRVVNHEPVASIQNRKEIMIVIVEQEKIMIQYFTETLKEMGLHYVVCNTAEDVAYVKSCTYCLIRNELYGQMEEELGKYIGEERIVLVLNIGEEAVKGRKKMHHVSLPLFCFQIINILNHDKILYAYGKQEYDLGQIKPLPFATVLIVDDNETNLYVAKGMMSIYKMEIDTARSGYDALVQVKKNKYDLIFMDHMMPELDGIDTTKKIREMDDPYYKNVPIVALTANAMSGAREGFIKAGFDDFLAKPIEYKELDRVLREFVLPKAPEDYKETLQQLDEEQTVSQPRSNYSLQVLAGHIEGIHMREKVAQFGGDVTLYLHVLRTYYEDLCERKEMLKALCEKEEMKEFTISVHALKSASYNVGADQLGKMAELFEHAGKENDIHWIQNNWEEFLEKMEETIHTVSGFLLFVKENQKEEGPKEVQREHLTREYLEKVKGYCEDMDFTALEQEIAYMKKCSYEKGQAELVKGLTGAYEEFEYEKFTKMIEDYLQ